MLGALRIRDYRRFWLGSLVSSLGLWIQTIALGWLVYDLTHAATWLGTVSFCGNAPMLVLGLVGGAIADRASRRLARSAIAPPISPRTSVGAFPAKLTVPSHVAESVRS